MAEQASTVVRRPGDPKVAWVLRLRRADGSIVQRRIAAPALIQIGSREGADLEVRGPGVAPHHASLRLGVDHAVLHDRGSPLGTYVNSLRCREPQRLGPEDRVTIAGATITVSPVGRPVDASRLREGFLGDAADDDDDHDEDGGRAAPTGEAGRSRSHGPRPRPSLRAVLALGACSAALAGIAAHALASLGLADEPPRPAAAPAPPIAAPARLDGAPPPAPVLDPEGPGEELPTTPWTAAAGDSWESLGRRLEVAPEVLRALNPGVRRPLRGGDVLRIPARGADDAAPPARCGLDLAIPGGAAALGEVNRGSLSAAIQLPDLEHYALRCKPHAFATTYTARHLIDAIACFRGATAYTGEVVIGDVSREHGGPLGHHKSHQSGRDVDLWLPVVGGRYLRGCPQCGTDLCRPEPEAVDWRATWALIDALAATGAVSVIFLDASLQPALREAALAAGASPRVVEERIQWPRTGAPTLVQHADGHVHHMHVRFRCGPDEDGCSELVARR